MIAYTAWDYALKHLIGDSFTEDNPSQNVVDILLYLVSTGAMEKVDDTYTLTSKGSAKASKLKDYLSKMSKGIPLSRRTAPLPMWFLLRRNSANVAWYRGVVREKNLRYITDKGAIIGGSALLDKKLVISRDLYLHYFPAPKALSEAASLLTSSVYKKKPKRVTPYWYQRNALSSPGVVWFRDVDEGLYSMSCAYYEYLTVWSNRARLDPRFGVVQLGDDYHFTVECDSAPDTTKLVGDLTAIVAQVCTSNSKEFVNAKVSR